MKYSGERPAAIGQLHGRAQQWVVRATDAERRPARAVRVGYPAYLLAVLTTYLVAFA